MKRTALTIALATMLASACGGTPTPTANHSPAGATHSAAAASGTLSCRLPVAGFVPSAPKGQPNNSVGPDGQDNQKGTGGFLDLPGGTFTPAKDSNRMYLASAKQWLPVTTQAISPDQGSYVLNRLSQHPGAAPTASMVLVEIATKAERPLYTPPDGQLAFALAFTSRGIYVEVVSTTGPGPSELLVIDPATGASHAVAGGQTPPGVSYSVFTAISGDSAWGMRITGSQAQPSYQLIRLNLAEGTLVIWRQSETTPLFVLGFDADGSPMVGGGPMSADGAQANLLLLRAAGESTSIPIKGGTFFQGRGTPVNDAHGTWFGSADGSIWLYSSARGLEKVASIPPQPGGTGQPYDEHAMRSVAGPCV
jgi:hypothetical protein